MKVYTHFSDFAWSFKYRPDGFLKIKSGHFLKKFWMTKKESIKVMANIYIKDEYRP